jgi:hypothetical protein
MIPAQSGELLISNYLAIEFMAEPTLVEVFGTGATQDADTITIQKSQLDLTASANNRAETLLAAIIKKAQDRLTGEEFNASLDQSILIAPGYDSLITRSVGGTTGQYYQTQLTLNFARVQLSSGLTPDDY